MRVENIDFVIFSPFAITTVFSHVYWPGPDSQTFSWLDELLLSILDPLDLPDDSNPIGSVLHGLLMNLISFSLNLVKLMKLAFSLPNYQQLLSLTLGLIRVIFLLIQICVFVLRKTECWQRAGVPRVFLRACSWLDVSWLLCSWHQGYLVVVALLHVALSSRVQF